MGNGTVTRQEMMVVSSLFKNYLTNIYLLPASWKPTIFLFS